MPTPASGSPAAVPLGWLALDTPAAGRRVRPYQLQAAIAYEHDRSASYAETDWDEILRLYDLLLSVAPKHPAALDRAVVGAERDGAEAGLAALANLPADPRREAVRPELLGAAAG